MLRDAGRGFSFRAALFSAGVFFGLGIYMAFFPLWLERQGLSEPEIATVIAAPLLIRIVATPVLTGFADRLPNLGVASALYALLAGLLVGSLAMVDGYWPILILSAAALVFWNAIVPLSDAVILFGARERGIDYARVRLWGSVGFIAAGLSGAEVIRRFSEASIVTMLCLSFLACALVALAVPRVAAPGIAAEPYGLRRAFADPLLRNALLAANLIAASHGAFYAFASLFWGSHGFGGQTIGALWAASVVAEIALFWAARFLPGGGARGFLLAGGLAAMGRWMLFPLATSPGPALALQLLHALSFALTHLGIMRAIGAVAIRGHTARLQAAHQVVGGVMLALTTLLAGPLYELSPLIVFWTMAALTLPALLLARRIGRDAQPQSAAGEGSTVLPE